MTSEATGGSDFEWLGYALQRFFLPDPVQEKPDLHALMKRVRDARRDTGTADEADIKALEEGMDITWAIEDANTAAGHMVRSLIRINETCRGVASDDLVNALRSAASLRWIGEVRKVNLTALAELRKNDFSGEFHTVALQVEELLGNDTTNAAQLHKSVTEAVELLATVIGKFKHPISDDFPGDVAWIDHEGAMSLVTIAEVFEELEGEDVWFDNNGQPPSEQAVRNVKSLSEIYRLITIGGKFGRDE
jgi:hypothetical protein